MDGAVRKNGECSGGIGVEFRDPAVAVVEEFVLKVDAAEFGLEDSGGDGEIGGESRAGGIYESRIVPQRDGSGADQSRCRRPDRTLS